jgi:hypothetical protein
MLRWPLAILAVAAALAMLPTRDRIPPLIAADNAYLFTAADRLYAGHGLTSTPPLAALQPWEWSADWAWLTQWPMGLPLLLCLIRALTGFDSVQAGQWLALLSCSLAMVGWYAWMRSTLPRGAAAVLVSLVAAAGSVSVAALVTPATDTLVVGLLPWLLLAAQRILERERAAASPPATIDAAPAPTARPSLWLFVACGVFAGLLFWVRYAAAFAAVGVGAVLLFAAIRRQVRPGAVLAFSLGTAAPVGLLVAINAACSATSSVQQQFNLGSGIGFDFSAGMLSTAWGLWTDLPFYNHKSYSPWIFAIVAPLATLLIVLATREGRRRAAEYVRSPGFMLGASAVAALFFVLIACTTLFKGKYNYIGLERYYRPIQPLYFLVVLGPLVALRVRLLRAGTIVAMLIAAMWFVRVEWPRPYERWTAANRVRTDYGRWEHAFAPHAADLFRWVRQHNEPTTVVFSNFHDEIALETWLPAVPLPPDRAAMARWIEAIEAARGVTIDRVLVIIDPDYHNREYYLPARDYVLRELDFVPLSDEPIGFEQFVYTPRGKGYQLSAIGCQPE